MKAFLASLPGRLIAWLHRMLSEDNGNPSSMRFVLLAWHGAVWIVWLGLSVYRREMVHIDESVLTLLGMMTGGKIVQKFGEAKAPPDLP